MIDLYVESGFALTGSDGSSVHVTIDPDSGDPSIEVNDGAGGRASALISKSEAAILALAVGIIAEGKVL